MITTATMKISDSLDVHDLGDLQLQALWALEQLSSDAHDRFSATDIANHLIETCGVSTYRQVIGYALEKERYVCNKNKSGYKLMEPGRRKLLEQKLGDKVIFIEANKPFSAKNVALKDVFAGLHGQTLICDPYIDIHTLDVIFKNSDKKKPIKILTKNIIDKPSGTFLLHLTDLRGEGYQVEVGVYASSDLHDRYIMDSKTFWLSGNSFNYLGKKESFIVRLGEDIRQSMLATFNSRWKVTTKI